MRPAAARLLFGLAALAAVPAHADLVTFEQTPGGAMPTDNALLSGPYAIACGGTVSFYFDTDVNNRFDAGVDALPAFERVGNADPEDGFFNSTASRCDVAGPGFDAQLGQYFLRQPAGVTTVPGPFIVAYATTQTITGLSGEIWDIDGNSDPLSTNFGTERWRVNVLDASVDVLASVLSPLGTASTGPHDAAPWTFAFSARPTGVDKVRITFLGIQQNGIGLAFNNFSPTVALTVPEPTSAALLAVGMASLDLALRRRQPGQLKSTYR